MILHYTHLSNISCIYCNAIVIDSGMTVGCFAYMYVASVTCV